MAKTILRPFVYQNYIDEYQRMLFNNYSIMNPRTFCTYYKFDIDSSVIDDRPYVQGGSYHMLNDYAGRMWKKIQLVPMWQLTSIDPIKTIAKEDGVVRELEMKFVLPDYVGIQPTPRDFIHIFNGVGNTKSDRHPFWIVTNKSESHAGKRKIYQLDCKNYPNPTTDIDDHIVSEWIYVNFLRKIYNRASAELILETLGINYTLFDNININEDYTISYNPNVCMFGANNP